MFFLKVTGFDDKIGNLAEPSSFLPWTTAMTYDIFGLFKSSTRLGLTSENAIRSPTSGSYGCLLSSPPPLVVFKKISYNKSLGYLKPLEILTSKTSQAWAFRSEFVMFEYKSARVSSRSGLMK
nr:hypothetical protein DM860_002195 [Ipomoea trifida]